MIIKELRLENIRSYTNEHIEFPDGSVLLSGDIGSGKSTILYAIEFSLFGIMRGELSGSDLLRNGAKEGSVEMRFELEGKDIFIKRVLKRTNDSVKQDAGYIIMDGSKSDLTPVELKAKIIDMIGYPKELLTKKSLVYRYTVYTPQEQMKHILFDDKEGRLETLRKVFDIDKYKRISQNAIIFIRSLKEKIKENQGRIADLEEKKRQENEYQKDLAMANQQLNELMPKIDSVKSLLLEKSQQLQAFEEKVKHFNEAKNRKEVVQTKINEKYSHREKSIEDSNSLNSQISDLQQKVKESSVNINATKEQVEHNISEREKRINFVMQKNAELREKINSLNSQINNDHKEIDEVNEKLLDYDEKKLKLDALSQASDKESMKQQIEDDQKKLTDINLKIREYEVHIKNANELQEKISGLNECPTCLQPVSQEHKHEIFGNENEKIELNMGLIKELSLEKGELESSLLQKKEDMQKIEENEKQLMMLKQEIAMLDDAKQRKEAKHNSMQEKKIRIEQLNLEIQKYAQVNVEEQRQILEKEKDILLRLNEIEHLNAVLEEKRNNQNNLLKLCNKLENEIELLNQESKSIEEKLASMSEVETYYKSVKEEVDAVKEDEKTLEIENASIVQKIKSLELMVGSLQKEIQEKNIVKKVITSQSQMLNWLENHFMKLMITMEKQIMLKVYHQFDELFQNWFSMLVEGNMNARLDDTFSPIIEQNGYETSLEALSGGEKTAVALAYRLALNKVINDVVGDIKTKDLLILDEPTDGFSREQLDKMKDVLDQLGIKQTIIVSHEPKVESFVQNIIRLQKNEHVSKIL